MEYAKYATLRDKRGLNDSAVSRATGVKKATLSQWRHSLHTPSLKTILKITKYFGIHVEDLISDEVEE